VVLLVIVVAGVAPMLSMAIVFAAMAMRALLGIVSVAGMAVVLIMAAVLSVRICVMAAAVRIMPGVTAMLHMFAIHHSPPRRNPT
jgi:hypothetical protein